MFRPDKIDIAKLDFEDYTAIWKLVCDTHTYYSEKEPNMFMVDQLIAGVNDSRMKPQQGMKLLMESYLAWMLIQDQGSKWCFAYLKKVFDNKRQKFYDKQFEAKKQKAIAEAGDYRTVEAAKKEKEIQLEIAELHKLMKDNKNKFTEDQFLLIHGLIKTRKTLEAYSRIENIINPQTK